MRVLSNYSHQATTRIKPKKRQLISSDNSYQSNLASQNNPIKELAERSYSK